MKSFLLFFFLISTFSFSQKKKSFEEIDSVAYYSNLRNSNVKANKYKDALLYTQKAIHYSKVNAKTEAQASETYSLGKLYYDVKKYDDAIKSFNNSISLFKNLAPSSVQAATYYYLGMCYMQKSSFDNAKICFDKAQSLYDILEITYTADLINLQRGIIYKSKWGIRFGFHNFQYNYRKT
jgi:tetratricopeptide (TPR) repeat protein